MRAATELSAEALAAVMVVRAVCMRLAILDHAHIRGVAVLEEGDRAALDGVLVGELDGLALDVVADARVHEPLHRAELLGAG